MCKDNDTEVNKTNSEQEIPTSQEDKDNTNNEKNKNGEGITELDKNNKEPVNKDLDGDLPLNRDYNSITKFFLDALGLSNRYKCNNIFGTVLLCFAVIMALLPIVCVESRGYINEKFKWIIAILGIIILVPKLIILVSKLIKLVSKLIKNNDKSNQEITSSNELYNKLTQEQKEFLSNEKILDGLIKYLRKGNEAIEQFLFKILATSAVLYSLYSSIGFLSDTYNIISYIIIIVGYAFIGFKYMSGSVERLYFLNLLQHIKVESSYKYT